MKVKTIPKQYTSACARPDEREDSAFDRFAGSLRIPLRGTESVLARTALEGRPYRITDARHDPRVHPDWEGRLGVDEFACAPLAAKEKVVGVLVVDNKFNGKPITDEDLECSPPSPRRLA